MAFDLRAALLRKEEMESARLMDFAFRQRARTFRLLAAIVDIDAAALVRETAFHDDAAILDTLANDLAVPRDDLDRHYATCRANAYKELVIELGDPAPHRLG